MIVSIGDSPRKGKRFRVIWQYEHGGKKAFDFSINTSNTYIDGASEAVREAYRKRHLASERERYLIENFIPSPSLFAFYITWGETRSISQNVKILNQLMD